MSKLKSIWATCLVAVLTLTTMQSCLDDDWNKDYPSYFAIGTLKVIEGNDYYFALDEGSKLYPGDTTFIHNYIIRDGQRAFVYFDKLDEKKEGYGYNAQIKRIENILTKDVYVMPADKNDSIGNDRINLIEPMWIADNYLNIKYQLYHSNNDDKKHMLNLVVDEKELGATAHPEYLMMELRHNAFDDSPAMMSSGLVSFKLDSISDLLQGKKGLLIRYNSIYDGNREVVFKFD